MEKLLLFFFALTFILGSSAIQVLDTPYTVRGVVWNDWKTPHDNVRTPDEPGFPYVQVTLLAQTSTSLPVVSGAAELIEVQTAFTKMDGSYRFTCLSPGYYAVRFHTPENRPSHFVVPNVGSDDTVDSDATQVDSRTAETGLFLAESGGSVHIDLGLYQYIFVNQFSLVGAQWVPPAPDTARGVIYAALNYDSKEMYYRIVRGEFGGQPTDVSAAFFQGWAGQNGISLRNLDDRFSPKENVWLNITADIMPMLFMGNVWLGIIGNGSFSSLARMRGQFYNFRNFRELGLQAQFSGRTVVPSVSTSAGGMIDIQYNLDRGLFSYRLSLSGIDSTQITSVGVYGPASVSSTGALLAYLDPSKTSLNVSAIPGFGGYFSSGQLYVQVATSQYPLGQVRANIIGFQPAVFTSAFNLTNVGYSQIARAEAVFTLDWRKAELYYYVYIEGVYQNEVATQLHNNRQGGWLTLDGPNCLSHENTVKQGYFFGVKQDYLDDLFAGRVQIVVETLGGVELIGTLQNWF